MHIEKLLIVLLFFFLPLCVAAQLPFKLAHTQQQKDSLNEVILKLPASKIESHMDSLFFGMGWMSREEALPWARSTVEFCQKHGQQIALVHAYLNLGMIDNSLDAYPSFQNALELADKLESNKLRMSAHFRMAHFQEQKFLKEESFKNILIALRYAKELQDTLSQHAYLADLIMFHIRDGNKERTVEIGQELLAMFRRDDPKLIERRGEKWLIMHTHNTMGLAFKDLGLYDSAYAHFDKASEIAHQIKNEFWVGLVAGNKGETYVKAGRYAEGLKALLTDIAISRKHNNMSSLGMSMLTIAQAYISQGDVTRASAYADSAKSVYDSNNIAEALIPLQYWELLADIEFRKGHFEKAWQLQKRFTQYKVKDIKERESEKVAKVQAVFDLEAKQNEINKLTHSSLIQQEQYKFQHALLIAAIAGLVLALLLVINFVNNYRKQRRATALAAAQRDEIIKVNAQMNEAYENLKVAQEQLIQTEKMALLGNLTSGVAHEINTPLGAIKASAENMGTSVNNIRTKLEAVYKLVPAQYASLFFLLINQTSYWQKGITFREQRELKKQFKERLKNEEVKNSELVAEHLLNIGVTGELDRWMPLLRLPQAMEIFSLAGDVASLEIQQSNIGLAVGKASKILFALKSYSYQGHHRSAVSVDVAENIEIVLSIYAYNLRQFTVVRNFEDVSAIKGYPDELNQVWTNLIHNALYAMEEGGTLSITIRKHSMEEILVEMTDNGKGILPEHHEKLFVPFFTTKAQGEGTGLGLSIVKKIVDNHHARIEFESEPGKGTTFRIFFPIDFEGK